MSSKIKKGNSDPAFWILKSSGAPIPELIHLFLDMLRQARTHEIKLGPLAGTSGTHSLMNHSLHLLRLACGGSFDAPWSPFPSRHP